jgi:DNA-binding XRE family transcriptional regulator
MTDSENQEQMEPGRYVRTVRLATNMTQKDFSEVLGINQSSISGIENGTFAPSQDVVHKATRHLIARGVIAVLRAELTGSHMQTIIEDLTMTQREFGSDGLYALCVVLGRSRLRRIIMHGLSYNLMSDLAARTQMLTGLEYSRVMHAVIEGQARPATTRDAEVFAAVIEELVDERQRYIAALKRQAEDSGNAQ